MSEKQPSKEYIDYICSLYGDMYDDCIEDNSPPVAGNSLRNPGEDWKPGQYANHKSLGTFQKQLKELGIIISTSKIRKILISGGCWTTKRSREIADLFAFYTKSITNGGEGLSEDVAVKRISRDLKC